MLSYQQMVIGWIEYAVCGTVLLTAAQLIVYRLRQPVDRVNLVAMSLIVSAFVPLLMSFLAVPSFQLGLIPIVGEQVANVPASSRASSSRPQLEFQGLSPISTEHTPQIDPTTTDRGAEHTKLETERTLTEFGTNESHVPVTASSLSNGSAPRRLNGWSVAAVILLLSQSAALVWLLLQSIVGTIQLRNLSRKAQLPDQSLWDEWERVSNGAGGKVRLMVTNQVSAPLVYGWWRPVVLVPESIVAGDPSTIRFCLAHEWSHVRCGDLRRWQLINLCQLLLWYQPLFWMLRRELRICQDLIADDFAADITSDQLGRVQYSELLLSIAQQTMRPRVVGAVAFYDPTSQLARRIKMLLESQDQMRSRSSRVFYGTWGAILLIASLTIGSVRLSAAHAGVNAQDPIQDARAKTSDEVATRSGPENAQTTDEAKSKRVKGRVVNESGQAVVGAKLWLPVQYQPHRIAEATSDDEGNFELNVPTEWISPSFTGSAWTVWVYAPGYSIQSQSVYEVLRGKEEKQYTIKLPPESNTRFEVLRDDLQPLADVLVKPQNYQTSVGYDAVPEEMHSLVSARTDKNGQVTLPALQAGPLFSLEMSHKEFGRQTIRVDKHRDASERKIRLQPTGSIKGRLVGEKREWVADVKMAFTTDSMNEWKIPHGMAEVVTDSNGNFEVPIIASGELLRTYVGLQSTLPVRPVLSEGISLIAGETIELEIPLVAAPLVFGKVVTKSTGQPVAGAEISMGYGGYRQSEMVTTDDQGQYQGRVLPGGVHVHIISLPDGFVQLGAPWAEPYQVPDKVDKFELPTIKVVGSHEIAGRLIGDQDKPLANTQVMAVSENRRYGFGKSDSAGLFEMSVPDGVETTFVVYLEDRGSVPVEIITKDPLVIKYSGEAAEKAKEVQRAAKRDVTLAGRVLSAGKPVAGVTFVLNRGFQVAIESQKETGTQYRKLSEARSDENGNYRLNGLKAGDTYQIEIWPPFRAADPTWPHQSPYIQTLSGDATGELNLPDIKLVRLNQSLSGKVVDPDGNPVKGATVSVQLRSGKHLTRLTESGPPPWTESDQAGRFQLKELPDEPLKIMAYIANPKGGRIRFPARLNVDMNQSNIRIVLDPSLIEAEEK